MAEPSPVLAAGDIAPHFSAQRDGEDVVTLGDYCGKYVVLYFYPKDDTPGCTKEAISFTEMADDFSAINAVILGVSGDTVTKHDKFKKKHNLSVVLVSDEAGDIVKNYGVWVEKAMYGKKYMGIERSTFLIGMDGRIIRVWRKVKVAGHAMEVLEAIKAA